MRLLTSAFRIVSWPFRRIGLVSTVVDHAVMAWYRLPVPPNHYYSPVADTAAVKRNLARWYHEGDFRHVQMDLEGQLELLRNLRAYTSEFASLPRNERLLVERYGQGYGDAESCFLHAMVRHFKPRRIVEVGSGISTWYSWNALNENAKRHRLPFRLECIEPYPSSALRGFIEANQITFHHKEVQDVGLSVFESLEAGDVLFIDSTHAGKIDSDVYYLYLEVLPRLKPGVLIHIHDITFPYLTTSPRHSLFDHFLLWNEVALVKAFLTYNQAFRVVLCQSYFHFKSPEAIRDVVPFYDPSVEDEFPASLWLQKVA